MAWGVDYPDFTKCFQDTVLVWTPCAFLWTFAVVDIMYMRNSINKNVPWSFLNVIKLSITMILVLLSIVDLVLDVHRNDELPVYPVSYCTPAIKAITFVRLTNF